jgi:hypothetical protein
MTRQTAIQAINELPKKFELDELLERLIFMDKVQKGIEQADKGEVISHAKVISSLKKKWA